MNSNQSSQEAVEDVLASIREIIEQDDDVKQEKDADIISLEKHAVSRSVDRIVNDENSDKSILLEEDVFNLTELITDAGEVITLEKWENMMVKKKEKIEKDKNIKNSKKIEDEDIIDLDEKDIEKTDKTNDFDQLMSKETADATSAAFSELSKNELSEKDLISDIGGMSVEELVKDTIRPLLKKWLDINLPSLVNKIVSEEIKKIKK